MFGGVPDTISNFETSSIDYNSVYKDIIIGGSETFNGFGSVSKKAALVCIDTNGVLNNNFGNNGRLIIDTSTSFISQSETNHDGDIICLVANHEIVDTIRYYITKVKHNGSIDPLFGTNGKYILPDVDGTSYYQMKLIGNDKILVWKASLFPDTNPLYCLNSNGVIDMSFGTNGIAYPFSSSMYYNIYLSNDNKILATSYSGSSCIFKMFNNNGSVNTSWGINGEKSVNLNSSFGFSSLVIQSDGKILMGGTNSGGTGSDFGLARLKADGNIDTTFGTFGYVSTDFDNPFEEGSVLLFQQNINKPVLVGYSSAGWENIGGINYHNQYVAAARYNVTMTNVGIDELSDNNPWQIYPNPAKDMVTISNMPIGSTVRILDVTGKVVYSSVITNEQTSTINTTNFTNGIYLIRIDNNDNVANKKLVINK